MQRLRNHTLCAQSTRCSEWSNFQTLFISYASKSYVFKLVYLTFVIAYCNDLVGEVCAFDRSIVTLVLFLSPQLAPNRKKCPHCSGLYKQALCAEKDECSVNTLQKVHMLNLDQTLSQQKFNILLLHIYSKEMISSKYADRFFIPLRIASLFH